MAEPEILTQQQHGEDERDGTAAETKDSRDIQPTVSQEEKEDPDAFVNNGLIKWQTARDSWCQKPKGSDASSKEKQKAIPIDVDGIIDVLFDPRWRGGGRVKVSLEPPRFPKNVPLPQMIDVLTDLWEAEGLDV
mmetsp:Transcript_9687/g.24138  ORF Transcript_9687/g.24138 Transcript_9687/m.24138 type:complete len:134 (+) Transcript_9687:393-794(+)